MNIYDYACAMIVHVQADQLLTQLLIDKLKILCLHNTGTLDIYVKKFDDEKYFLCVKKMAIM